MEQIVWQIDNLERIGGYGTHIVGSPKVIEAPGGKAVEFDGVGDGVFLDVHPLAGAEVFTEEVIFRPYSEGLEEQRFLHLQEDGSEDRILFETRLTDDNQWFLDSFVKSGEGNNTLYAEGFRHPIGPWYHAAIVVDGREMRHYVNGEQEIAMEVDFAPQGPGRTSIGVRINHESWYKGAVRTARFTRRVLKPDEFLSV